jgi:hypothetical protein
MESRKYMGGDTLVDVLELGEPRPALFIPK